MDPHPDSRDNFDELGGCAGVLTALVLMLMALAALSFSLGLWS